MPMICDSPTYNTFGDVRVSRTITKVKMDTASLFHLDSQRRGLFTSSYEYPEWQSLNPSMELTIREKAFTFSAQSDRARYHKQQQQSTTQTGINIFYQHTTLTMKQVSM